MFIDLIYLQFYWSKTTIKTQQLRLNTLVIYSLLIIDFSKFLCVLFQKITNEARSSSLPSRTTQEWTTMNIQMRHMWKWEDGRTLAIKINLPSLNSHFAYFLLWWKSCNKIFTIETVWFHTKLIKLEQTNQQNGCQWCDDEGNYGRPGVE